MRVSRAIAIVAFLATLSALPAAAHGLGTVQVRGYFNHDGTYRVDLIVDRIFF